MKTFKELQVGDKVFRWFGGSVPTMELIVSNISDGLIICGDYTFETKNGLEVDEDLGWGEFGSGSYITTEK